MKPVLFGSILGIVSLSALVGGAIAQSVPLTSEMTAMAQANEPTAAPALASGYNRYTSSGQYSIEFPDGAYLHNNNQGYLIMSNYAPQVGACCFEAESLKTDIYVTAIPFETAKENAVIDDSGMAGELVQQSVINLNGREAIRTWWINGDNGSDSVSTIVQFSETESAYITSFYATGDRTMDSTIEAIHNSFQALN
ncbi:MAG: PsbP-related protein [Cyanobacteria bacterium P01_A01_bin.123]